MSDPAAVMARLNEIVRAYTAKDAPCAQLDCLQCKVVATCADAAAVIAQLSETWTDEYGTTWHPPTAWAYAKACAALRTAQAERAELRAALAGDDARTLLKEFFEAWSAGYAPPDLLQRLKAWYAALHEQPVPGTPRQEPL